MLSRIATIAAAVLMVSGCATMTPTVERETSYAIYQVTPGDGASIAQVSNAITKALQESTSNVQITRGLPANPVPETASRFQVGDAFRGTNLSALAAMSGQSFQVVACDGALLHAVARESGYADYGEGTTFVVCLWQYQDGYHMDVVATYVRSSGAFNAATLGATLARQVVGDSSQFIPRTLNDLVSSVREAGAQVTLVEAYPPEHQP